MQHLAWQHAPYSGNMLLTLLALADWADDEGLCWPKIPALASKSRQSERHTQRCINQLMSDGFVDLEEEGGGRRTPDRRNKYKGNSNLYRINGDKLSMLPKVNGDIQSKSRVTSEPIKGDICDITNKEDTSEDTSETQVPSSGKPDPVLPGFEDVKTSPDEKHKGVKGPQSRLRSFEVELKRHTTDPWELEKLPRIWAYYCERTDRGAMYMATQKRVRAGLARMRDLAKTTADPNSLEKTRVNVLRAFKMAIDNLADDPFLSGQNDRQTEYRDWYDHLMKTWETFEKRLRGGKV